MKQRKRYWGCYYWIVTLASIMFSTTTFGATINVPEDYLTIQAGIDAAMPGDTVLIADGTYTGPGNKNVDFGGKAITLKSENGPKNCTIECEGSGSGFTFQKGETSASVVDGFKIMNGVAPLAETASVACGGGISCYNSSPTIKNCVISGNSAIFGGGICCLGHSASPTITDCIIRGNSAGVGGGISCYRSSWPTISNCTISNNLASLGAAISCISSQPNITNCTIRSNSAVGDGGGGVFCCCRSRPTITNCILWGNSPDEINMFGGTAAVKYCTVEGSYP